MSAQVSYHRVQDHLERLKMQAALQSLDQILQRVIEDLATLRFLSAGENVVFLGPCEPHTYCPFTGRNSLSVSPPPRETGSGRTAL